MSEMCSREHNPSSRIPSARRSPDFRRGGGELFTERVAERSRASVCIRSKRTDGPGSTTRRRPLWSTCDQLKNLAGLAARRVTFVLWPCWAPRVPRLQVSRSTTELLVCERTGICENARCLRLSYTRTSRRRKAKVERDMSHTA